MVDDDDGGDDLLIECLPSDPDESTSQDPRIFGDNFVSHADHEVNNGILTQFFECYVTDSVFSHLSGKVGKWIDNQNGLFRVESMNSSHQWPRDRIQQQFARLHHRRRMHRETPLSNFDLSKTDDNQPECVVPGEKTITCVPHIALFASHNAVGIVDSGASQTIMGSHQEAEFLSSLPAEARAKTYESPANMSFRFGNNSTVTCTRAIVVPVGPVWIKIAIVDSRTPFLISNNVLRQLGAVIDTEEQSIHFKRLQCSVPLLLTDRKLFTLDISEMIGIAKDTTFTKSSKTKSTCKSQPVLHTEIHGNKDLDTQVTTNPCEKPLCDIKTQQVEHDKDHIQDNHPNPMSASAKTEAIDKKPIHTDVADPSLKDHLPTCVNFECHPSDHHVSSFGRSSGESQEGSKPSREEGGPGTDEFRRTPRSSDSVRQVQGWSTLPPGDARGSQLCDMVCENLRGISKGYPPRVPHVHRAVHGAHGDQDWKGEWCCLPESRQQGQEVPGNNSRDTSLSSNSEGGSQNDRGGRRLRLGCRDLDVGHPCRECHDPKPTEPNGECHAVHNDGTATDSAATTKAADPGVNANQRPSLASMTCLSESVFETHANKSNWVAREMWQYFKNKGFLDKDPQLIRKDNCDLVEVYCSSDSQLTKQCLLNGGRAHRFGLKQGDLQYAENRFKLYDVLMPCRPSHLWVAPKCTAWCKWNQFNMQLSIELADKIMRARESDEVHLLLCAALYEFQCWRGRQKHFHLEQPIGSDMLYQPELQAIYDRLECCRCDQCVAGNLIHPESKNPIKKGMQILSTSKIMTQFLNQFKCPGDHSHHTIAGSIKTPQGRVSLSQYTELYTHVFARRVVRAMQAITQVREEQMTPLEPILHNEEASDLADEPDQKRRRLLVKQERPPEFPEPPPRDPVVPQSIEDSPHDEIAISTWMQSALEAAPRVGKLVIQEGPLFQHACRLFPDTVIRCLELCKGTDRFRKPAIPLMRGEAPYRRSIVIHRNDGNIIDNGEWWSWEDKSNRQLCQKSPPARLLVSLFGRPRETNPPIMEDSRESLKRRDDSIEDANPQPTKRFLSNHEHPESENIKKMDSGDILEDKTSSKTVHHGPKFLQLDKAHQQWVMKIHQNLGHPSAHKLKIVLKDQQCPQSVIEAIDDYRCSVCHESQRPRHARPSTTSSIKDFNDSVGCDGIQWTAKDGSQYYFFHFIDAATNFHVAHHTYNTDALGAFNSFQQAWLNWAGPCEELVVDGASAFCAEKFAEQTQGLNVKVRVVAAQAHWQLGKVEGHGEILQEMLRKYDTEHEIKSSHDFNVALTHCCNAKNALSRHQGYTPEILVLGKSRKLPGANSQNSIDAAQYLADSDTPEGVITLPKESVPAELSLPQTMMIV